MNNTRSKGHTMNKTLQKIAIAFAMIMGLALPVAAQTTVTTTTLSANLALPAPRHRTECRRDHQPDSTAGLRRHEGGGAQ
jgi:hypothetical protein